MINVTFRDWFQNYNNYWTNGEVIYVKEFKEYYEDDKGKKVEIYEKNIGVGQYPSLTKMKYISNGCEKETTQVKKITYDNDVGLFLFEDYMIIDNRLDGAIYYYVDFLGNIVTDAWTNLVDEIYDKNVFWKYAEGEASSWLCSYDTNMIYDNISRKLDERNKLQRQKVINRLERKSNK